MNRQTDSSNWRATARYVEGMKLLRSFQTTRDWKQLHAAICEFTEAVTIDPSYNAARFYLGVSQELDGKHKEAAEQFEELRVQTEQPDLELLYNLGLAYFHQYHPAAYLSAIEYLQRVIEFARVPPPQPAPTEQERYRESIQLLARAVLAQVYSHMAIPPKGVSPEEAQEHFQEALRVASDSLEEFERHRDHLDPALVSDIGWGLHNAKGHAYLYAGRRESNPEFFEGSIREFNLALQFDPANYRVLSNLGSAHFFLAELAQGRESAVGDRPVVREEQLVLAEQRFRRVLQLKPHYDFAYARLAKIALQRGNVEEAEKYATLAKQNPSEMTPDYIEQILKDIERARKSTVDGSQLGRLGPAG